jgi:putative membrane protein
MIRAILFSTALSTVALAAAPPVLAAWQGPAGDHAVGAALTKEDADFFDAATQGGMLEVKLGQLALKQGASDDVKKFAQRMIDDHGKLDQQLADVAQKEGLSVPQELDKKHQETLDKLSQLSGNKLDQEYVNGMVSDHKDDLKLFEKEARDGKDPGLKQFAASSVPTLTEHLAAARQLQEHLKK